MITFSYIFEKTPNKLIGLKFETQFLSSEFLSIGETEAILAFSGKTHLEILLLIAFVKGSDIIAEASFTNLAGIPSIPVAF